MNIELKVRTGYMKEQNKTKNKQNNQKPAKLKESEMKKRSILEIKRAVLFYIRPVHNQEQLSITRGRRLKQNLFWAFQRLAQRNKLSEPAPPNSCSTASQQEPENCLPKPAPEFSKGFRSLQQVVKNSQGCRTRLKNFSLSRKLLSS